MASRYDAQFSTDVSRESVVDYVDMRPTTLLEQSLNDGFDRVTKPVGVPTTEGAEIQTTGGRALNDTLAAIRLGATGRKK